MGSNVTGFVQVGIDFDITNGPDLATFLGATLRGGTGLADFTVASRRVRGARPTVKRVVNIVATCEDGSGQLFNFTGTIDGRQIKGYYNAKETSPKYKTGSITFRR